MIRNIPAKKLALLVLALLLAAVVLDLLLWFISPGGAVVNQPGNVFYLDLTGATPVNCAFDDAGHHIPVNGDPQLNFPLSGDQEIKSVAVKLAQPLRRRGYVQLYYGVDEILELNSAGFWVKAGTREFYFNLPGDQYTFLRLDINADCWLDAGSCGDQPASFFRSPSLNPLRILLIAALLVLGLFVFTRAKVKTFIRKLDHDWIDPETRKPVVTVLYAVFAMAMVLHHIVVTIWYPAIAKGSDIKYLWLLFPVFALVSVFLGHMWKDRGFWFLFALVVLEYLRLAIPMPVVAEDFASILYAFFGCYSVAKALGSKARKPFLQVFCAVWTLATAVLSFFGFEAAWFGTRTYNLSENLSIYISVWHRLELVYSYGAAGIFLSVSLVVSAIGFCLCRRLLPRLLYAFACVFFLIISCMTGARTVFIATAVSLSTIVVLLLYDRLKPVSINNRCKLSLAKKALLLAVFCVLVVSLVLVQNYIPDAFNRIRSNGGLIVSNALAEPRPIRDLRHRNLLHSADLNVLSSGRIALWDKVFSSGFRSASDLFFGQSIHQPMNIVNADIVEYDNLMNHCHNLWIQTLLESGIPGLLLLLALHVYFLMHAFRLLKNKSLPFWQRLLPLPALAALVSEVFEHTASPDTCFPQLTLLYLFMGFTIAFGSRIKESSASSASSARPAPP